MTLSYKKLWKLLIDRNMNKTDLREKTGLSQATIAKLVKGENVNTDVLKRICSTLNCKIEDIVELVDNQEEVFYEEEN
ncbi:MAG: helix-turn-helix transcriptional regulator [Acholeplasmatales bacterium]|nr:helix-turn-helix transcriptional regulator [Acholeplasmatales bacterium]